MPVSDTIYVLSPESQIAPPDTLVDTDLDHALSATYSTSGIDIDALTIVIPPPPPTWEFGLTGIERHTNAGDNSGVLAIITGMTVLMMLSYKHCKRLFSTLFRDLLGMRNRANVFDEHTSNETRVLALMALQWSVYTGLLLYSYIANRYPLTDHGIFIDTVSFIGLMACYYIFQLCAYWTVGYTFSSDVGCRYFVKGFTSSQSLLGFMLILPALVAIFYPEATISMVYIGASLYLIARVVFLVKGFRIFYHNFSSLLYFILYLCTLEIIPLIVLYKIALTLVRYEF